MTGTALGYGCYPHGLENDLELHPDYNDQVKGEEKGTELTGCLLQKGEEGCKVRVTPKEPVAKYKHPDSLVIDCCTSVQSGFWSKGSDHSIALGRCHNLSTP